MIPGAVNFPAHSLFLSAPTLVKSLSTIPIIIFHCNRSNGRGPRAAGWYADCMQSQFKLTDEEVAKRVGILQGGIVAWEEKYGIGEISERGNKRRVNPENDKKSVHL